MIEYSANCVVNLIEGNVYMGRCFTQRATGHWLAKADLFTFDPVPSVSSVTPPNGPLAGGTVVTVPGSGFTKGVTADLGTAAAISVTVTNGTTLMAQGPFGSYGSTGAIHLDARIVAVGIAQPPR